MFGHDEQHALGTVVQLVNTAPETAGSERLADLADLRELVRAQEVSGVGTLSRIDLDDIRALRAKLLEVFDASEPSTAARLVNAIVATARTTPRLTDHDGHQWHVHYFSPDASLTEHLAADCGMALARVIAEGESERLRRCEAADCNHVLVDLSRNRSKRYCDSRRCGNRMHVAAYRERRRVAGAAVDATANDHAS